MNVSRFSSGVGYCYRHCLRHARMVQAMMLALCVFALVHVSDFKFDASSDTLVAQGDPKLRYYRQMTDRFGESSFLVLTYMPDDGKLFQREELDRLQRLEQRLGEVPGVRNVASLLDAPLIQSPPVPLTKLASGYRTLRDPIVDLELAREELTSSPLFSKLLVSADGSTTAMRIDLVENTALAQARAERDRLAQKADVPQARLAQAQARYQKLKQAQKEHTAQLIADVRAVRDQFTDAATLYLGGIPMVTADIIDFVRSDITSFGVGVVLLIALSLYAFFRKLRWVFIPLGTVSVTILLMVSILGYLGRPATAISANFISLISIITISFTIHLIARYRELAATTNPRDHVERVYETMRSKFAPCLYTALTTAVAFGSLTTSDILPVEDFGWIMVGGTALALLVTYAFFAGLLVLLRPADGDRAADTAPNLTIWFCQASLSHWRGLLVLTVALGGLALASLPGLNIENRFTEYFRSGSEIREGMVFIDRKLGGTIPIDVVLDYAPYEPEPASQGDDPFGSFDDMQAQEESWLQRFWFTPGKLRDLERMQEFLDQRTGMGKTISVSNLERIARTYNNGEPLDYVQITAVLAKVPEDIRKRLIEPYASPESGEMRIAGRIHETGPQFSRSELINDIEGFAVEELGFEPDDVHVTGMAVLFNDMLRHLVSSQTSTIAFVILATGLMFAVLLRSVVLAVAGLIPNLLAALLVLAAMSLLGIPLDLMTITVAAIVIGIGVDDAIHYLHRFREERAAGHDAATAVRNTHGSIGRALYFTTITVVIGFSVLALSNFVPTIHFGLLASLAMILALAANLTVLPSLLLAIYGGRPNKGGT